MFRHGQLRYGSYGEPRSVWCVPLRSVVAVVARWGWVWFGTLGFGSYGLLGLVELSYGVLRQFWFVAFRLVKACSGLVWQLWRV